MPTSDSKFIDIDENHGGKFTARMTRNYNQSEVI